MNLGVRHRGEFVRLQQAVIHAFGECTDRPGFRIGQPDVAQRLFVGRDDTLGGEGATELCDQSVVDRQAGCSAELPRGDGVREPFEGTAHRNGQMCVVGIDGPGRLHPPGEGVVERAQVLGSGTLLLGRMFPVRVMVTPPASQTWTL